MTKQRYQVVLYSNKALADKHNLAIGERITASGHLHLSFETAACGRTAR